MSNKGKFADFSNRLNAAPEGGKHDGGKKNPDDPDASGDDDENEPEKDKDMKEEEIKTMKADAFEEGRKAGFKSANDRVAAVFASDEAEGRFASAAKLLSKEALSATGADDVIDILADMPKQENAAGLSEEEQKAASEEAGRKVMREQLDKDKNTDLDDGEGDADADAGDLMKGAVAKVNVKRGFAKAA